MSSCGACFFFGKSELGFRHTGIFVEVYSGWREAGHLSVSLIIAGLLSMTYSIYGTSVAVITVNEIHTLELLTGHIDLSHYIFPLTRKNPKTLFVV